MKTNNEKAIDFLSIIKQNSDLKVEIVRLKTENSRITKDLKKSKKTSRVDFKNRKLAEQICSDYAEKNRINEKNICSLKIQIDALILLIQSMR